MPASQFEKRNLIWATIIGALFGPAAAEKIFSIFDLLSRLA